MIFDYFDGLLQHKKVPKPEESYSLPERLVDLMERIIQNEHDTIPIVWRLLDVAGSVSWFHLNMSFMAGQTSELAR